MNILFLLENTESLLSVASEHRIKVELPDKIVKLEPNIKFVVNHEHLKFGHCPISATVSFSLL